MVAANVSYHLPSVSLAERIRDYFDRHPQVSREEFMLTALDREIDHREQVEPDGVAGFVIPDEPGIDQWPSVSAQEVRAHAWLSNRTMVLRRKRPGRWARLRRFLFGGRRPASVAARE